MLDEGAEQPTIGGADHDVTVENDLYRAHDGPPNTPCNVARGWMMRSSCLAAMMIGMQGDSASLDRQCRVLRPFAHRPIIEREVVEAELVQQEQIDGGGDAASAVRDDPLLFRYTRRSKFCLH